MTALAEASALLPIQTEQEKPKNALNIGQQIKIAGMKPNQQYATLAKDFGEDNVIFNTDTNEINVRKEGEWKPAKSGFVAELIKSTPTVIGSVGGALGGGFLGGGIGAIPGGASGGAAGNLLVQELNKRISGVDEGIDLQSLAIDTAFGTMGGTGKTLQALKFVKNPAIAKTAAKAEQFLEKGFIRRNLFNVEKLPKPLKELETAVKKAGVDTTEGAVDLAAKQSSDQTLKRAEDLAGDLPKKVNLNQRDDLFWDFDPANTIAKKAARGEHVRSNEIDEINQVLFRGNAPDFVAQAHFEGRMPANLPGDIGKQSETLLAESALAINKSRSGINKIASQNWKKAMEESGIKPSEMLLETKTIATTLDDILNPLLKRKALSPDEELTVKYLQSIKEQTKGKISIEDAQGLSSQLRNYVDDPNLSNAVKRNLYAAKSEIDQLKYLHPGLAKASPQYRQAMQAMDILNDLPDDVEKIPGYLKTMLNEDKNSLKLKKLDRAFEFFEKTPGYEQLNPRKEFDLAMHAATMNKIKPAKTGEMKTIPGLVQRLTTTLQAPAIQSRMLGKAVREGTFDKEAFARKIQNPFLRYSKLAYYTSFKPKVLSQITEKLAELPGMRIVGNTVKPITVAVGKYTPTIAKQTIRQMIAEKLKDIGQPSIQQNLSFTPKAMKKINEDRELITLNSQKRSGGF